MLRVGVKQMAFILIICVNRMRHHTLWLKLKQLRCIRNVVSLNKIKVYWNKKSPILHKALFAWIASSCLCVYRGGCAITVLIPKLGLAKLCTRSHVPKPFCLFSYQCDKLEKQQLFWTFDFSLVSPPSIKILWRGPAQIKLYHNELMKS